MTCLGYVRVKNKRYNKALRFWIFPFQELIWVLKSLHPSLQLWQIRQLWSRWSTDPAQLTGGSKLGGRVPAAHTSAGTGLCNAFSLCGLQTERVLHPISFLTCFFTINSSPLSSICKSDYTLLHRDSSHSHLQSTQLLRRRPVQFACVQLCRTVDGGIAVIRSPAPGTGSSSPYRLSSWKQFRRLELSFAKKAAAEPAQTFSAKTDHSQMLELSAL